MGVSPEDRALAASALVEGLGADAPIGFAVHDERLRFELISHSLAAINGRPVAEHLGRRAAEILPPGLAGPVEAALAEVRDSGVARTGVELGGTTGTGAGEARAWVAGFYPVELAGRRLVGVVVADVTGRRRAQDELRESEALLSGAQRMAGIGWWTWTARPESMTYAPELLDLLGHDPAFGGLPYREDMLIADAGERRSVREDAYAVVAAGRPFSRRIRTRHADGRERLMMARADVVRDADGTPVGLEGFAQDITEIARAEQRQRILAELGQRALEERDLDALFRHAVDAVGREVGIDGVGVLELLPGGGRAAVRAVSGRQEDGDGERTIAIEPGGIVDCALSGGAPVVTADLAGDPRLRMSELERGAGVRGAAVVVIDGGAGPFGVLGAMSGLPDHFSDDDAVFLAAIATVLSDAVERHAADAEIAEISAARGRLVAQTVEAEDQARRDISEALHDGALQELLAVRNELYAMGGRGGDDAALEATLERLCGIVTRLRDVMSALHPTMLHYGGLEAALLAVVEQARGGDAFRAHVVVDPAAAGARDELVLSLARELLANAARHGAPSRVDVGVHLHGDELVLRVADDGAGYAPGRPARALADGAVGLAACRDRVEAVGGRLELDSAPGAGTHATVRIPRTAPAPTPGEAGISRLADRADRA